MEPETTFSLSPGQQSWRHSSKTLARAQKGNIATRSWQTTCPLFWYETGTQLTQDGEPERIVGLLDEGNKRRRTPSPRRTLYAYFIKAETNHIGHLVRLIFLQRRMDCQKKSPFMSAAELVSLLAIRCFLAFFCNVYPSFQYLRSTCRYFPADLRIAP